MKPEQDSVHNFDPLRALARAVIADAPPAYKATIEAAVDCPIEAAENFLVDHCRIADALESLAQGDLFNMEERG